ncbi:MAG: BlaI/MecI/CopY family transcriptional regulator [Pirellulales bacterium]
MARSSSNQPTEVELQILRILWDQGPSIARQIHDSLQTFKQTTYSTTVKMLSVMLGKGLVKRDESVSPQVYRAAVTRDVAGKRLVKDLVEKVYDGAAATLVLHALRAGKSSAEDLAEIRKLLDEMEGRS